MAMRDHWQNVYATKSSASVSWFQAEALPSLAAIGKLRPAKNTAFIDVGGGASTLVDALLAADWNDVSILDIADSALAVPKARLGAAAGRVNWIVADITTWHPARQYGLWHDRAVYHFLTTSEERDAYRTTLEAGLAKAGHLVLATFALDGPDKCSGLPVQRHDAASVQREIGPNFRLLETWPQSHETPSGNIQKFNWCLFQRI
ncbi:class I SAM-dependent methyltransferase [Aestuariivirga litoralis]|uniref:class I SAM-dependent methyltransferase n=1 Tax=Aestuariivirga litoralis TaxID=2650924 RepID=UPI0018C4B8CA|nr:class I SAM-dependent methyltransferase [Aestuariivirga litoralis]MBG1232836.1 class I SAM-dependent methyltransferase [Aestuariivirga litoralis]